MRVRSGQQHQRAGLGDGTVRSGNADLVVATSRPRFDREAGPGPVEARVLGPAHAGSLEAAAGEIAPDRGRHLIESRDFIDGAGQ